MSYLRQLFEQEPNDDDYVGNIFGWKLSFYGLALIILVGAAVAYGHFSGKVDITTGEPIKTNQVDSTLVK
jgi:hypothetical protein